jgi:hypothetical protein
MAPSRAEWEPFLNARGPVRVQHADGTPVAYGDRGRIQGSGGKTKIDDQADLELALSDGTGTPGRVFPGDQVISIEYGPSLDVVVVEDDIDPDPGPTVITRGDQPPSGSR